MYSGNRPLRKLIYFVPNFVIRCPNLFSVLSSAGRSRALSPSPQEITLVASAKSDRSLKHRTDTVPL